MCYYNTGHLANFSKATWALAPKTILGLEASFSAALRAACHRRFKAKPPSIMASDEPAVAVPMALESLGAFQRSATGKE